MEIVLSLKLRKLKAVYFLSPLYLQHLGQCLSYCGIQMLVRLNHGYSTEYARISGNAPNELMENFKENKANVKSEQIF